MKQREKEKRRIGQKNKHCAYSGCQKPPRYFMTWPEEHGYVCGEHDRILGRTNLGRLARMTLQEAIAWDKNNKEERST